MYYFITIVVIMFLLFGFVIISKYNSGDPDMELQENNKNRMMSRYKT